MLYHCIYSRSHQDGRHIAEYVGSKECDTRPEGWFNDDGMPFMAEWDEWVTDDELPEKYPSVTIEKTKPIHEEECMPF